MQLTGASSHFWVLQTVSKTLMPCCDTMYTFDHIGPNCCVHLWERSFKHLQGSSWWAVPAISGGSELWVGCRMPSYNKVYSLDNCWMLHNFLTSNIRRILLTCWRMQLTSCSTILWELWINWMTYHLIIGDRQTSCKAQIFKYAVDQLFQQSLSTPNLGND